MRRQTTFGWAVLYPDEDGWAAPGAPVADTVADTRDGAMERFADRWRTREEAADHQSIVWRRWYRRGWRLSRIVLTPFGSTP